MAIIVQTKNHFFNKVFVVSFHRGVFNFKHLLGNFSDLLVFG